MRRLARDIWEFALRRRGWLLPVLVAVLLIAALTMLAEGAALSPLVYPLF